jgi:hypothetical protein
VSISACVRPSFSKYRFIDAYESIRVGVSERLEQRSEYPSISASGTLSSTCPQIASRRRPSSNAAKSLHEHAQGRSAAGRRAYVAGFLEGKTDAGIHRWLTRQLQLVSGDLPVFLSRKLG